MCPAIWWTGQRGDWFLEGETSRPGLCSSALHSTFNVLVGAQPVPSIECSLSKLKQTERHSSQQVSQPPVARDVGVSSRGCQALWAHVSSSVHLLSPGPISLLVPISLYKATSPPKSNLLCHVYCSYTQVCNPACT